jgi:hypothetical protein
MAGGSEPGRIAVAVAGFRSSYFFYPKGFGDVGSIGDP